MPGAFKKYLASLKKHKEFCDLSLVVLSPQEGSRINKHHLLDALFRAEYLVTAVTSTHFRFASLVTMATKESKKCIMEEGLIWGGNKLELIDLNPSQVDIEVHWVPIYITDEAVKKTLQALGLHVTHVETTYSSKGEQSIYMGIRKAKILLQEGQLVLHGLCRHQRCWTYG